MNEFLFLTIGFGVIFWIKYKRTVQFVYLYVCSYVEVNFKNKHNIKTITAQNNNFSSIEIINACGNSISHYICKDNTEFNISLTLLNTKLEFSESNSSTGSNFIKFIIFNDKLNDKHIIIHDINISDLNIEYFNLYSTLHSHVTYSFISCYLCLNKNMYEITLKNNKLNMMIEGNKIDKYFIQYYAKKYFKLNNIETEDYYLLILDKDVIEKRIDIKNGETLLLNKETYNILV